MTPHDWCLNPVCPCHVWREYYYADPSAYDKEPSGSNQEVHVGDRQPDAIGQVLLQLEPTPREEAHQSTLAETSQTVGVEPGTHEAPARHPGVDVVDAIIELYSQPGARNTALWWTARQQLMDRFSKEEWLNGVTWCLSMQVQ